jgi:glycosyltransferase involved in cell wall biosynthesis
VSALRHVPEPSAPDFEPIRVVEVELGRPLPELEPASSPSGAPYTSALVFCRLHDEPVGMLRAPLAGGRMSAQELATRLEAEVGDDARRHLRRDGLPADAPLGVEGFPPTETPACVREREAFLQDAPRLTVLIPSRERAERLGRCLDSILACEYPDDRFDILVVDNAPETDGTLRVVQDYAGRTGGRVRYAREDATGSASARNRGLDLVDTEIVVMTDDDVLADPHWLTEVARTFTAYPQAACVSGLLLPAALDSPAQVWFEQYGGFSRGFERRVFDLVDNRPADPLYPWTAGVFGTGNNFSFRVAPLREIGGFDPALGNGTPALGGVDSEVLLRTILSGQTIVYEPRALVYHAHRPDYNALRRQVYAYGAGLVAYYLKTLLARPRLVLDFARALPAGLRFMFSSESHINQHKESDYPSELTWLERRGFLYGPLAYARSRRKYGPHRVPA